MKIIKAIREASRSRVPAKLGRITAVSGVEPIGSMVAHCDWRVRHELTVSFSTTGPEVAVQEMKRRAEKAIASEVFGELRQDLIALRNILWEGETFRGSDDPAMLILNDILQKIEG